MSTARVLLVAALAVALAGCAGRSAPPPTPAPPPAPPPAAETPPPVVADSLPRGTGAVTAPWDTAGRSGATRRAHVYPEGESAVGKRLVASLPDPGGLPPAEGTGTIEAVSAPVPATAVPATGCWEAQLAVTSDPARAESVRAEAAALLGVSARVVNVGSMYRVRAGGCLDAEAALRLVERARAEGWPEAFRTEAAR